MFRYLIVLLVACRSLEPVPVHAPNDSPRVATDAGASVEAVDAQVPAELTFPSPLPPSDSPTPAGKQCRKTYDADVAHEEQREAAALDAALRAQGFTPLRVNVLTDEPAPPATTGRWLRVDEIEGCGAIAPVVAMTASHEVFVVVPKLVAAKTRVVTACHIDPCFRQCGAHMPPSGVFAEVPADAKLAAQAHRQIDVKIDVAVKFRTTEKQQPCLAP
jgi:hypothetical protein